MLTVCKIHGVHGLPELLLVQAFDINAQDKVIDILQILFSPILHMNDQFHRDKITLLSLYSIKC
jgi:hypothetical protein